VALAPDRVLFMHRRGILRDRVESTRTWATDASNATTPLWQPALDMLGRNLPKATSGRPRVSVVLSNHFCHYALLKRRDELTGHDERLAYARHRMKAAFGEAVGNWDLKLSDAGEKSGYLASAVDSALLEAIRALCRDRNFHLLSIQPYLAVAFNRCRKALEKRTAWFVVHEDGRLVVSLFNRGMWAAVASRRVSPRWKPELLQVLDRELQLGEAEGAERHEVLLYAPGFSHAGDFKESRYRVELLRPGSSGISGDREHAMAA
jgi:hypothetical protein